MSSSASVVIIAPDTNRPERKYAIDSLFSLVDVNYEVKFDENYTHYKVTYDQFSIVIKDDFFINFPEPLSYFSSKNIPASVHTAKLGGAADDLVVIFGKGSLNRVDSGVECGIDVFASTFFMLTRWEEHVIEKRNKLGKVVEDELLAVRGNFFDRPIVNEYAAFLCNVFGQNGHPIKLRNTGVEITLTHDVDWSYLSSTGDLVVNLISMLRSGQYKRPTKILMRYLKYRLRNVNPFDTFDEIMDYSDKYGFTNSFYFKASKRGEPGYTYQVDDPFVSKSIGNIQQRGHEVGFHPSENTLNSQKEFNAEVLRLKKVAARVKGGRAHHLLYGLESWRNWNSAGLKYDSGCGFQYRNGFRAGITSAYEVFDIMQREKLPLKQKPFLLMDSVWLRTGVPPQQFFVDATSLIDTVFHYGGVVCVNWHSNLFSALEMRKFRQVYFQIVDYLGGKK